MVAMERISDIRVSGRCELRVWEEGDDADCSTLAIVVLLFAMEKMEQMEQMEKIEMEREGGREGKGCD